MIQKLLWIFNPIRTSVCRQSNKIEMIISCRREKILESSHSFVFRWPSRGSKMGQGQIKWNWCQWCNKRTISKENENKIKVEIVCYVRSSVSFSRLYCSSFMLKVRVYVKRGHSDLIGWLLGQFLFHVDTHHCKSRSEIYARPVKSPIATCKGQCGPILTRMSTGLERDFKSVQKRFNLSPQGNKSSMP